MLKSSIPQFHKERRDRLAAAHSDGVFIFRGAHEVPRNPDVTFPFRQETNFYYLTGFDEPEAILVMAPRKDGPGHRSVLFIQPKDPLKELWEGERYDLDHAKKIYSMDDVYPVGEFRAKMPELLRGGDRVFTRLGLCESSDRELIELFENHRRSMGRTGRAFAPVEDPGHTLGEMRLFKSAAEIELMRAACSATARAHRTLMEVIKPGQNEADVEALVEYEFRKNGCKRMGYGSIIAGGVNATCLHYKRNDMKLKAGDLLLIDAGGEREYYTADITRTFPVSAEFNAAQRKTYELVLKSQKAALDLCKPGSTLVAIHDRASEVLVDGMLSLGLLQGKTADIISKDGHRRFYPHNTGHWLGMDVHDVGLYRDKQGQPRKLEVGMAFTVEPGFYVQPSDKDAPSEYRDIGIRIEDNVVITASGHENMTLEAPKEIEEIQGLRSRALK